MANTLFNGERWKAFSLRSETRQGCPFLAILLNIVLEVLATRIRQENETKGIQNWKGNSKTITICRWHISENPKDFTQKLSELINKFLNIAGYKINTQTSIAFL